MPLVDLGMWSVLGVVQWLLRVTSYVTFAFYCVMIGVSVLVLCYVSCVARCVLLVGCVQVVACCVVCQYLM